MALFWLHDCPVPSMILVGGIAFSSEDAVPVKPNIGSPSDFSKAAANRRLNLRGLGAANARCGAYACSLYGSKGKASPAQSYYRYVCVHIAAFFCRSEVGRTCVSSRCFCERRTVEAPRVHLSLGPSLIVTGGPLFSTQPTTQSRSKLELGFILVDYSKV